MKRNKGTKILGCDRPSSKLNYLEQYLVYEYEGNFAFPVNNSLVRGHVVTDFSYRGQRRQLLELHKSFTQKQ